MMGLIKLFKIKLKERGMGSMLKYIFLVPIEMVLRGVTYSPLKILVLRMLGAKVSSSAIIFDVKFLNRDNIEASTFNIGSIESYDFVFVVNYYISYSKEEFYLPEDLKAISNYLIERGFDCFALHEFPGKDSLTIFKAKS